MSDWQSVCIGDIANIPKKQPVANPQAIELLTVRLYAKGVERTGKYPRATERGRPYFAREAGEILIGRQNFHNGGIGIVGKADHGLICSNAITSLIPNDQADKDFLFYLLSNSEFRNTIQKQSEGTGQSEISETKILSLELALPPLPEQKKIAEILSGIDNNIAALKQSKRIRIAAHEQAMAEFINDSMGTTQDLEEMGYEVLDGDRGDAYPKEKDFNSNGYCLFLSAKNVTKSGFNFGTCQYIPIEKDCEMRKGRLERGDIVITTRGTLGNIAYFDDSIPIRTMRINSGMAIIRARASKNPGKEEFLLSCLLSDFVQNQIRKASFGTAQNQLTLGIIKRLRLPVLSITNEILFTKQCNALSSYGKKLQDGIGKREHLKQTIASDLLSGRKRVSI